MHRAWTCLVLAFALTGCGTSAATVTQDGSDEGLATSAATSGSADEESEAEASSDGGAKLDLPDGDGDASTGGDSGGGCSATIPAAIRDFHSSHVDFEVYWGTNAYTGLVLSQLGADNTPTYNPSPTPPPGYNGSPTQITSEASFADWYHDVDGVNLAVQISLPLTETTPGSGVFSFEEDFFFPLDDAGFNAGGVGETFPDVNDDLHNFHFTTEVHTNFVYEQGQTFAFDGDDDLWLFINKELVIDLGGLHGELSASVDLDTLGLVAGQTYALDLFHAERRHNGSHFRIDTSISCFAPVD